MTGDGRDGWVLSPNAIYGRKPKFIRSINHMGYNKRMNVACKLHWAKRIDALCFRMPFTERIVKRTVPSIRMDRGRDGRTTQASDRRRPNKILIGHVRLMDRGRQGGMIHPFECHWRIVKETLRSMTGDGTNGWVMPSSVFDRTNPKIIRSISHMWSSERMNVAYKADWTASK